MSLQQKIISEISTIEDNQADVVKTLSRILNISTRAVRNRLNHTQDFTLMEFQIIIDHYHIDILKLFKAVETPVIEKEKPEDIDCYAFVNNLLRQWVGAVKKPANKSDYKFYLATNNFPVLLAMGFPDLIKFKIYLLAKYQWLHPGFQDLVFDKDSPIFKEVPTYTSEISSLFKKLPSVEIWGNNTILSFVKQLQRTLELQHIDPRESIYLGEQLLELLDKVKGYAKSSRKHISSTKKLRTKYPDFQLIYNDMLTIDEYTLISWSELEKFYSIIYHPIFGFLTNKSQKEKVEQYFLQIQREGYDLCVDSNDERNKIFKQFSSRVEAFIEEVKKLKI